MDQKKSDRKTFFSDNDHKVYVMGQKNTFSDHFFSEEELSEEEQVIKKSGNNGGRSYQKNSDHKNSYS